MSKLLIVIDMQNDFIDGSLGSPQAQAIVPTVAAKVDEYRENGDEFIFTHDTHYENYLETQEGKNLPVKHCIDGTHGWEITDKIYSRLAVFHDKHTFGSIELVECVKDMDVSEVELVGLCTDICVVSNALILKAGLPEMKITVDASCCAGITEESHNAALLTMKMCQVNVINWGENND